MVKADVSTFNSKGGNRREAIVIAATELFREKGFKDTTMRDIAKQVSILEGSIYYYFTSKQALLFEVVIRDMDQALLEVEKIYDSSLCPREKLRQLIRNQVLYLTSHTGTMLIFAREQKYMLPQDRDEYVCGRDRWEGFFRQTISQGMEQGAFRAGDVRLIAMTIMGMCNWITQWFKPSGPYTPETIAEEIGKYACDWMLAREVEGH